MKALEDKLRGLLIALGDTPETIAAFLAGEGVTGICGNPQACALAEYLSRGIGLDVAVYPFIVNAVDSYILAYDETGAVVARVAPPWAVNDFVTRYDAGEFPELIR